jgi:hypothetical protein
VVCKKKQHNGRKDKIIPVHVSKHPFTGFETHALRTYLDDMTVRSFQRAVYKKKKSNRTWRSYASRERGTFADRRGGSAKVYNIGSSWQETGSEEGTKQVSPVCVCCRHHDRLSKPLLVSPHYDAGSTSLTVTYRSNSNSPAKLITKVPTRDLPIQSRSVNQFSVVFGRRLWWQL